MILRYRTVCYEDWFALEHLQTLYERDNMGLFRYTNCTIDKIVTYVRQRGLQTTLDNVDRNQEQHIASLEAADNELTFERGDGMISKTDKGRDLTMALESADEISVL